MTTKWPEGDVIITWVDDEGEDGWHNYTILGWNIEIGMVYLRGRKNDNGCDFSGPDFWVKYSEIEFFEDVKR